MSYIGRVIYGYCEGWFGRDTNWEKRIEGEGQDWIVARGIDRNDRPELARFKDRKELEKKIESWLTKPKDMYDSDEEWEEAQNG